MGGSSPFKGASARLGSKRRAPEGQWFWGAYTGGVEEVVLRRGLGCVGGEGRRGRGWQVKGVGERVGRLGAGKEGRGDKRMRRKWGMRGGSRLWEDDGLGGVKDKRGEGRLGVGHGGSGHEIGETTRGARWRVKG